MRFYLIISIILLSSFSAHSAVTDSLSSEDKVRIYSGFRFGFGGAKQRNTVIFREDGQFAMNPNIGAVFWFRFKQHTGLVVEANYSLKGIRFKREVKDTTTIYQRRLHYVEFPILFQASIGSRKFSEYFEVGIVPSYVAGIYDQTTHLYEKQVVSSESSDFLFHRALENPTKRFDMSVLLGAGMNVKLGPGILQGGFRTNIGLLDIYKEVNRVGYVNKSQRQFSFQIQFGYIWHMKSIK